MSMLSKIDWVEIPDGQAIIGLSQAQADDLLGRLPESIKQNPDEIRFLRQVLYRSVPERSVVLRTFYISRFPITNKQYLDFARTDHPSSLRYLYDERAMKRYENDAELRSDHPAIFNAAEALAFCDWLGARLPTSEEWEKAARGTDGRLYLWGNIWDPARGNFTKAARKLWGHKTAPVTAYPSGQSPYGVMDMAGNTYEYVMGPVPNLPDYDILCRGCDGDYDSFDDRRFPDWFRNLAMMISFGQELVGVRPVIDTWPKTHW